MSDAWVFTTRGGRSALALANLKAVCHWQWRLGRHGTPTNVAIFTICHDLMTHHFVIMMMILVLY